MTRAMVGQAMAMGRAMAMFRGLAALAAALLLAGCAGYTVNPKLTTEKYGVGKGGYRYENLSKVENTDALFVVLAFSGGGTRAAAFSYGLMEGLRDATYKKDPAADPRSLLADVDVISSVSGGSFTAAYYGLFPDRFFEDFEPRVLDRDIQGDLIGLALSPPNWFRLASPAFDRIDLAAEYYDREIFDQKTFQALVDGKRKPYIVLNATDMTLGRRFEFTQEQFDFLCSDLSPVTIARAVAASSAFPGLLSPLTLKNYVDVKCGFKMPTWIEGALKSKALAARRYVRARDLWTYRSDEKRQWIHLLDGGLSDNIGLRGPFVALTSDTGSSWSVKQRINQGNVERVMVITANAKTKSRPKWDQEQAAPGLFDVLGFVSTGPMDNFSFDTVQLITNAFEQRQQAWKARQSCRRMLKKQCGGDLPGKLAPVALRAVEISFDGIADHRLRLRLCMEALPTNFSLPAQTVDLLRQVARHLLLTSPKFHDAMNDLEAGWEPPESAMDPDLIAAVCPR